VKSIDGSFPVFLLSSETFLLFLMYFDRKELFRVGDQPLSESAQRGMLAAAIEIRPLRRHEGELKWAYSTAKRA